METAYMGAHLAENDALADCQNVVKRHEGVIFVFLIFAVQTELADIVN